MHKRVKVCVRVRPSTKAALGVAVNESEKTISVITNPNGNGTCFHFDEVLGVHASQAQVFDKCASEVVDNVLTGYNGTIMAYGQTGAGKTFTMSGGKTQFEQRGICARAISSIFHRIHNDSDHSYCVRVSYVEIYNEQLFDLLDLKDQPPLQPHQQQQSSQSQSTKELVVQEIDKGQTFIRGLTRSIVENEEQALDLLFRGDTNRTIAEHCLNASSTRSHCIFTLYIEKQASCHELLQDGQGERKGAMVFSKLNLVDLAGSERMKKTQVTGQMLKEATHINKSLTFLEQVVIALGDKKRDHIPYRQTLLTNILKDSLGGNCRTLLIACVWPEELHNDQSLATLKFATRMMRVRISAVVNVAQDASGNAQKYLLEIKQLKQELAMHDVLTGRCNVAYSTDQVQAKRKIFQQQLEAFVNDESQRIPVESVAQVEEIFRLFRDHILQQRQRPDSTGSSESDGTTISSTMSPPQTAASAFVNGNNSFEHEAEAILTKSQSVHTSWQRLHEVTSEQEEAQDQPTLASSFQVPSTSPQQEDSRQVPEEEDQIASHGRMIASMKSVPVSTPTKTEKELFEEFKQHVQPDSAGDLELAKQNLKKSKQRAAQLAVQVNQLKNEIDSISLKIQAMAVNQQDQQVEQQAEATSAHLVVRLKDAKKRYRDAFETFQESKAEINYLSKVKDQMLRKLSYDFEMWQKAHNGT